jgi:quercetin dioxygenase-like cupin family protein
MADAASLPDALVATSGRALELPAGPIFHLHRAAQADFEIGAFRGWAGYKDLGADAATNGLALFQHVLSFGPSDVSGRTGIHCHLAQVHIVIPVSGRGLFSYDGVVTEAAPGAVIVQHGGTVHDQFFYSYAPASDADNRRTPVSLEPSLDGGSTRSFGFLELFVPRTIANVEIVPPERVSQEDQATAWDHPYHAPGARFALQGAEDPAAVWRPAPGRSDLVARDAATWAPTGELVATFIVRPALGGAAGPPVAFHPPGESGGLDILYMAAGSARFRRDDGASYGLEAGDCLTCSAGLAGELTDPSPDMRLVRFFISARAERLRERTPAEIARLEALGHAIITRKEARGRGDARPINTLHEAGARVADR